MVRPSFVRTFSVFAFLVFFYTSQMRMGSQDKLVVLLMVWFFIQVKSVFSPIYLFLIIYLQIFQQMMFFIIIMQNAVCKI